MNKVMIGKLVNWIVEGKESISVKWVQHNHLKGKEWMQYKPSANTSWVWRRICSVKQDLSAAYTNGSWDIQGVGFFTAYCYEWLKGSRTKNNWFRVVWNEWVVPKHQFLGWLLAHGAFRTKAKLVSYGMDIDDCCYLCGQATEDLDHVFFRCAYSKKVVQCLHQKTRLPIPTVNVLNWCIQAQGSKLQKGVHAGLVVGAVYHVWHHRNQCWNEGVLLRPEKVADQVVDDMRMRARGRDIKLMTLSDLD
ncbi:uncharacterized protein LOC141639190 [Silene latifolia]|uniref:uncharacterized protein LOC141639190 n=1 Tax=Silene latifolia TaxID=37657 RepID=UPI003D78008F